MNLRKVTLVACTLLLAVLFASCGTMRRFGKDVGVVVTSPLLIPYAAGTDAASSAQGMSKGLGGSAAGEVIWTVPAFFFHVVKHTFFVAVHGVDILLTPVWGLAELHPSGPEIQPLDYYQNTWFDKKSSDQDRAVTDAQSGETTKK